MPATFEVDKRGLAQIVRKRGIHRAIEELLSNAMDEKVSRIVITLEPTGNHMEYRLAVEDDSPEGFRDLTHAYTLFAPSYKKDDPSKRGRFNFGEKWVIAICKEAKIVTTKGTVIFEGNERRTGREKREAGTVFEGLITATKEEYDKACLRIRSIIPSDGVTIIFNGDELYHRQPLATFEATLPTVTTNADGELIRTERKTEVRVYEVQEGEEATVYELGIPVVKTGDVYHVDVRQKVPVNLNRDNVPPRFLKVVRTEVLDHTFHLLTKEQCNNKAVTEALEDAKPEAVAVVMTQKFGEKRAIYDPSDPEANNRLMAEGYTIIPSNTFDRDVWCNVKKTGAAVASGWIRPTPKPYSEGGRDVKLLDPKKKTAGMVRMEKYIRLLAAEVCGVTSLSITWVNDMGAQFSMCCGKTGLDINVARLGYQWFEQAPATSWKVDDLLLDEFGHFREENHLSDGYYRALREFGAKIGVLKLTRPELFAEFR